ncbi:MAG: DUF2189 domain-containing protein, partial [Betaproteobacteria bacterium]|nr:DUF2189 domain-containing protein [Betaproteobacteria bacterium]
MNDPVSVAPQHCTESCRILPGVRRVAIGAPLSWLGRGWRDLRRQPGASLFYGIAVAVTGAVILGVTANLPYLFAAAITGFLLVAPMLAAGLYELSRRYLADEPVSLGDSILAWKRNPSCMIGFGLLSIFAGTLWQVISVVIVALLYKGPPLAPLDMIIQVL